MLAIGLEWGHDGLEPPLREAVLAVLPDASAGVVTVRPCPDPKFGDYQTTSLMALAKERKLNPRQVATDVLARLDVNEWCEQVEIAGAGFLNFRLKPAALAAALEPAARGEVPLAVAAQPVVLPYRRGKYLRPVERGAIVGCWS